MSEKDILKNLILIFYKDEKKVNNIILEILENYGSIYTFLKSDDKNRIRISKRLYRVFENINLLMNNILYSKCLKKNIIKNRNDLINYLKFNYIDVEKEILKVIYLDVKNNILKEENLFYGTIDNINIYPREIVKNSLKYNAKSLILVHNHPSGDTNPSSHDIEFTKEIKKLISYFDINLLDHIIVSNFNYYSFWEQKEIVSR